MSKANEAPIKEWHPYETKMLGIARPLIADVYVLAIQYEIPINGRDWHYMNVEQRIDHYKKAFNSYIEDTVAEIERHTQWYCEQLKGNKDEQDS